MTFFSFCHCRAYFSYRHIRACPEYPEIPGTRYACPRMTKKKRKYPSMTKRKTSPTITIIYSSFPCLTRESIRDIRVKPEYDRKEAEDNCREWQRRKISPLCDLRNGAEVAVAVNLNDTQLMVHFFNRLITVDGRISVQNTVGKSLVSSFGTFSVNSRQTVVVA